jgi:hypothetical protein
MNSRFDPAMRLLFIAVDDLRPELACYGTTDFKDLLAALCKNEVRFLVVGGYAGMFHTEPRFTE